MIGRKSAVAIAETYEIEFYRIYEASSFLSGYSRSRTEFALDSNRLYDFLYANDYPAWFCNATQALWETSREKARK